MAESTIPTENFRSQQQWDNLAKNLRVVRHFSGQGFTIQNSRRMTMILSLDRQSQS